MANHRVWRLVSRVWITLGVGGTIVFIGWSLIAYRASSVARNAALSDSLVTVDHTDGVWRFVPNGRAPARTTLVFFPGALVDPRAYAPLARSVAEAGYPATLVELPRRGAFNSADSPELDSRIRSVLPAAAKREAIVVGGHSRGAVVASRIAATNTPRVSGLVIIGSSHPRDHDLSSLTIPVTKIVGTRDGLASPNEVRQNAALLPPQTRWIWIEGGNHSQFGWYGFQPLDRRPRIDAARQRAVMLEGVLEILRNVDQHAARPGANRLHYRSMSSVSSVVATFVTPSATSAWP
ncbi:MAG: hypothetical protein GEU90_00860 [Gemmatimonas sp.]|nr:hypothetical protein [Gemmatimonas sp.]